MVPSLSGPDLDPTLDPAEAEVARRAQVEEQLRASRDELDVILRGVTDGLTAQAPDGRMIYANESAARMMGFASTDALLATPVAELMDRFEVFDEAGRRLGRDELSATRALRGESTPEATVRWRRVATGEEHWTVVRATPARDERGAVRMVINFFRDVTEVRRAREREHFLAEASALLGASLDYPTTLTTIARLAVPRLADWCVVEMLDAAGQLHPLEVVHVNPTRIAWALNAVRRYPTDPAARTGSPEVVRTGRPEIMPVITDAMLVAAARDAEQLEIYRSVGFTSVMCVPLAARGRVLGAISFIAAGARLRYGPADLPFAEELARRAGLAIDNARLYREAQEASRLRDEFLATVSHELRTPLTAILGWAHIARARCPPAPSVQRALEIIERNARVQAQLTDDLLDVSRIITGKLSLDLRPTDVAATVHTAVEVIRPTAAAKGVNLEVVVAPAVGTHAADPDRLHQVVWNLLSNAVKFTPRGGRVALSVERRDDGVQIQVRDTGMGFRPSAVPYLFDRFWQAESATSRTHGGLGLGLAIVRHLVEMHGGTVRADSAGEGLGATFTITLPATPLAPDPAATPDGAPGPATAARHSPVPGALEGLRVLVVDDDPDGRELLATVLSEDGAAVREAATAAEALRALDGFVPDVLVSDVGLPGADGYDLMRAVRALAPERGGRMAALALTAYARPEDARQALDAGFQQHMSKPFEPETLVAALAALVARARRKT